MLYYLILSIIRGMPIKYEQLDIRSCTKQ